MTLPIARAAYKIYLKAGHHDEKRHYEEDYEHEKHEEMDHNEDEDDMTFEEFSDWISLLFVFIAFFNMFEFASTGFRFRNVDDYYKAGELLDPDNFNYWKWGNDIYLKGAAGIWSIAFITQLLSYFDIAHEVNFIVWEWGVFGIYGLLTLTYAIMSFMGWNNAYYKRKSKKSSDAEKAAGKWLQDEI